MPWAEGTAEALKMPRMPHMMSSVTPFWEKPAPRQKMEKRNMEPMNMDFRPNRSAILPKNSSNDPEARLTWISYCKIGTMVMDLDLDLDSDLGQGTNWV